MAKIPVREYSLYDKLNFGKYKGETIKWIIENDNEYVEWLIVEEMVLLNNEAYLQHIKQN